MELCVNTAIIGGGPAGMACALSLQQRNISAVVIEKQQFPRDKTCGGLVTQKTVEQLEKLVDPSRLAAVFCDCCDTVELYDRDRRLTSSAVSCALRSVRRREFDAFLAAEYTARGGQLLERCVCREIDPDAHRLELQNGDTIRFEHLVAADGALSVTRKRLGLPAPPLAFCVETHIPKAQLPEARAIRIVFGLVRYGYAWVFPSGDELCIGFGSRSADGAAAVKTLKDWLRQLGLNPERAVIRGAFVPFGSPVRQNRSRRDVLLIGDAGGFVDPLYGEGLYLALTSGMRAAAAIEARPDDCLAAFTASIQPEIRLLRQGVRFQKLFFSAPVQQQFLRRVEHKDRFVGYYCDRQLSRYRYPYAKILRLLSDYRAGR